MKRITLILVTATLFFSSCKKESITEEICPGGCTSDFEVVSPNASLQPDGYWHVQHNGPNYFTVEGKLSELNPEYVINGVPLIEANFDSDYWVLFDSIQYTVPMYSYLGWYSNNQFTTPINIGSYTYTLQNMANVHPPLNIVGYQINPNICWDCPYTPTLFGVHSKYNYEPRQNIFFDNEMIGDTAQIFIQVKFNNDIGPSEIQNKVLKVIFE